MEPHYLPDCLSCRALSGDQRISPGPIIIEGRYWVLEHAYPCKMLGWLVLVLKRHVEALHELSAEEFAEYGELLSRTVHLLHQKTGCQKEYAVCFAEVEHFKHIHFHVIQRPHDIPEAVIGSRVFALLKAPPEEIVPAAEVRQFCEELRIAALQQEEKAEQP